MLRQRKSSASGSGLRHARRAFSFLEVVFAVVLLSLLSMSIVGAVSFVFGRQRAEQQSLGACEIANRLMLQYLDDKNSMPDPSLPVEYGPDRYRWDMRVDPVIITPAEPARPRTDAGSGVTLNAERRGLIDKVKQVTIRAWLGEESGGSYGPDALVPNAKITRLVYPMANRNPDSFQNMVESEDGLRQFRDELSGVERPAPGARQPPSPPPANRRAPK